MPNESGRYEKMEQESHMELLETHELSEWEGEALPEGFRAVLKHCDEWSEPVVEIWKKVA